VVEGRGGHGRREVKERKKGEESDGGWGKNPGAEDGARGE